LSGGEALLRDDLHEIIGHIRMIGNQRKIDYPIILISNGRLMNEEHLKFFKEMNVHLSMSLPGYLSFEEHTGVEHFFITVESLIGQWTMAMLAYCGKTIYHRRFIAHGSHVI
jgi:molybdenum cofactor biosynthesis enzyme MoaA